MPIDAVAALIATGFFPNTESTFPVETRRSVSTPSRPLISMTVSARSRKASPLSTTTAVLAGPVAMRSPMETLAPAFAAVPLMVARPSRRCSPGGRSPAASTSRMSPLTPAAPRAANVLPLPWERAGERVASFSFCPFEDYVPYAVAQVQSALLELRLRPRRRARREGLGGVAQARRRRKHGQHVLGIVLPVG